VKRAALLVLMLAFGVAGAAAAYALADSSPPPSPSDSVSTDTATTPAAPPTSTRPKPTPRPPAQHARIASGVTIAGIHVGGLTYGPAYSALSVEFRSPLVLRLGAGTITVSPWKLGAKPFIGPAVRRALQAKPGTAVKMVVAVEGAAVSAYVNTLAAHYDRNVADAHVVLKALRPVVVPDVWGTAIERKSAATSIVVALQQNRRTPLTVPVHVTRPQVTAGTFSTIIVVRRDSKWLYLYKQVSTGRPVAFVRRFEVATGQPIYPTPIGSFKIIVMERDPWWYPPPDAPWAQGAKPIPPGPGNPLGTRWMGLSAPGVGIHGTPDPASLGYSASHGCIRMFIPSAEWLFDHVQVGTPVFIVPA
jgi:lipoprotein-anchoring transpeptidase ErfK/SrfK